MARGGRNRTLTSEERELWLHVTRHDQPMKRLRARKAAIEAETNEIAPTPTPQPQKQAAPSINKPAAALPQTPPKPSPVKPEPFDARLSRKIARGQRAIDARLDLHGLRQDDAYATLKRFLLRAQAQGCRTVLVITGKGSGASNNDSEFWRTESRGVLKRLVPMWLSEPDLRLLVVSFTEAAIQHGGSGALYITLRRNSTMKG